MNVGIPWRGGDTWREEAFAYVLDHIHRSGCSISLHDTPGPFNRAAARNAASRSGAVILHDADMVAPPDAYEHMASLAETSGRLVIGFHQYRPMTRGQTLDILAGTDPFTLHAGETTEGWSVGGIIAITPDAYAEVGGMDERFAGWGGEDFAFAHACSVILGPNLRLDTPAVHLWHPHASGHSDQDENMRLMAEYTAADTVQALRLVQGVTV